MPARRTNEWVLLAYRLPREPSTPRIALWRRLRRLGAAQLLDGLVALPLTPETREQLEWAAEEVVDAGGDASVWIAASATAAQERALVARMSAAVAADYRVLITAAKGRGQATRRRLQQLRRTLHAIEARDHFHPHERERARRAVEELAERLEVAR